MADLTKIQAASFWPGLQNIGQTTGTASISGTLDASPNTGINNTTSNMTGTIFVPLPDDKVIGVFRLNFPDANDDLASKWFPIFGALEVYQYPSGGGSLEWKLILTMGSATGGRNIYFNFVNATTSPITFSSWQINIYGHLYTYPWS